MEAQPVYVQVSQPPAKSAGAAVLLELLPGFLVHVFGIGHIYSGRLALGLLIMFGYWFVQAINLLLCFILIGFVTLPLTWIVMLVASPLLAAQACAPKAPMVGYVMHPGP